MILTYFFDIGIVGSYRSRAGFGWTWRTTVWRRW